jgi:predicted DNA-binding transcriptional regulator AlpA
MSTASLSSSPPFARQPSPFGSTFLCDHCDCMTQFVSVSRVVRLVAVSRSTVYYWMERGWIHWRLLPSGRRVVCWKSLSNPSAGARKGA